MEPNPRAGEPRWLPILVIVLVIALVGTFAAAVIEAGYAHEYYTDLSQISPCNGGLGTSFGCPAAFGPYFAQLGRDQLVNGTFVATFLVVPGPPPEVNSSALSLRVYNFTTNVTLVLENVTLALPNGSLLAAYSSVGGNWSTPTASPIWEVSVLRIASTTDLAVEQISLLDSAVGVGSYMPIA